MLSNRPSLQYLKLRLSLDLGNAIISGRDLSSAFRGLFGRALKDTFCIQRNTSCPDCSFSKCIYKIFFENEQAGYEQYRPYIICHLDSTEHIAIIELTILGTYVEHLNSLIHAIMRISEWQLKLGQDFYPIAIKEIIGIDGRLIYSKASGLISEAHPSFVNFEPEEREQLQIKFTTPLRMKTEGRLMSHFEWTPFFRNLYNRLAFLDTNFNAAALELPELWADDPSFHAEMLWQERQRLSYRQMQKMSLGGLVGSLEITKPHPNTVALLKIGEIAHVGKQTTFGLGKYEIL